MTAAIFFRSPFSAVKGYFFEFLVSNILVTSLSSYFGTLPRQRDLFISTQLLIVLRYSHMRDEQSGCCPPLILGLQRAPRVWPFRYPVWGWRKVDSFWSPFLAIIYQTQPIFARWDSSRIAGGVFVQASQTYFKKSIKRLRTLDNLTKNTYAK